MADEMVDGLGEKPYIPILPTPDDVLRQALYTEKTLMTGFDYKLMPRIWTGELERALRIQYMPTDRESLKKSSVKPRKTPLLTRIKNRLADKLRVLATRLDGWAPQDADWYD